MSLDLKKCRNILLVLVFAVSCVLGQDDVRFTQGDVNEGATLSLGVPLRSYKGRGIDLPISLNYSSSVWSIEALKKVVGSPTRMVTEAIFAKRSKAGWRSGLDLPVIEFPKVTDVYSQEGKSVGSGSGCYVWRVSRVYIHMPDGSTHELRESDTPHNLGYVDMSGTFYAVDGSRMRYDSTDADTGTLYLSNGTRYIMDAGDAQVIDRNGNTMSYDGATRTWTDTLGREIVNPLPLTPTVGTYDYTLPGLDGVNDGEVTYTFKWEELDDALTDTEDELRYVAGHYLPYPSATPDSGNFPQAQNSNAESIFHEHKVYDTGNSSWSTYTTFVVGKGQEQSDLFNPVVLTEVTLPDGSKYQFSYNSFGEIDKVIYPTNAYEEYVYESPEHPGGLNYNDGLFGSMEPYVQSERRITSRKVSADGTGSDLVEWEYEYDYNSGKATTTAPDGTSSEIYKTLDIPNGTERFGYSTSLKGMVVQKKTFSSTDAILRRELTAYEQTSNATTLTGTCNSNNFSTDYTATRNPRPVKTTTVLFEGSGSALAQTQTSTYDTTNQYTTGLDQTQANSYHFAVISNTSQYDTAQLGGINDISMGSLANYTVTSFSSDSNYQTRNILGLPTEILLKDASNNTKARTQISYDDSSHTETSSGTMPSAASASWVDPVTELGSTLGAKRGWQTIVKSYYDLANSYYIQTESFYDQFGNLRKLRDGRGNDTVTLYDDDYAFAYATKIMTPIPDSSGTYGLNDELETTTTYDYDTGLPLTATGPNGGVSEMEYEDDLLRPTKVIAANDAETITEYGAGTSASTRSVKIRSQIDASNWKEAYSFYDGVGRTVLSQTVDDDENDIFTVTCYDEMGRVEKTSNPVKSSSAPTCASSLDWTTSAYDDLGRTVSVSTPDSAVVDTAYSLATTGSQIGTAVTVEDQADKLRRSVTNALGQLIRVDEPNSSNQLGAINSPNQDTVFSYDTNSNLTGVTQGSQTRSFTYDALSRLKQAVNPESGTIDYTYDENGNLVTKVDARSTTTTFAYDRLNRVKTRGYTNEPSGSETPDVSYYYDNLTNGKGKLIKVSSSVSATEFTAFDISGNVTSHKQTTDGNDYTTAYSYNLSGGLIEETYPSTRKVKNSIDTDGGLSRVASKKNSSAGYYYNYANNFTYNAAGAVTSMELGNGRWESTAFNSRLQPTQVALGTTINATDMLKLEYSYGDWNGSSIDATKNNGNIVKQIITVPTVGASTGFAATQKYYYDSLNRIDDSTEEISGQTWRQDFSYDRYGNRNFVESNTTTLPKNCGTSPNFTVCTADQKKFNPSFATTNRINTSEGYSFDASGNTTGDTDDRTFIYDAENKQIKILDTNDDVIGEYFYDGDGKRIKKYVPDTGETTIFVYDAGGKQVAEYSTIVESGSNAKVAYTTNDNLGSPRINTNASGGVIARHDYHPFGEEISTAARTSHAEYAGDTIRKKFTGYERDGESELDFAQARYFNSGFGRFSSPDPFLASGRLENPQTWNRYIYVLGNPLRYIDPTGCFEFDSNVSVKDRKRIEKAYKKLEKALKNYKEGSKEYKSIDRALKALGAPGQKNGVTVYTGSIETPAETSSAVSLGADDKVNGSESAVVIDTSKSGDDETLARVLGHEGSHVADAKSEASKLIGKSLEEVEKARSAGEILSKAVSEVRAYRVASYIAAAISPSNAQSVSVNQYEIWNRGWSSADADKNRDAAIRGVLEAGWGSYKFKYTPILTPMNLPGLNNSITNSKQWSNGGERPIL